MSGGLLADTHLLLWAAYEPERLPPAAADDLTDASTRLVFSSASIWEVAIKAALGRADFTVDPDALVEGLRKHGWIELPVTAQHAAGVHALPPLHRDPFDRMLVAQARAEGLVLLTRDPVVAGYGAGIRLV